MSENTTLEMHETISLSSLSSGDEADQLTDERPRQSMWWRHGFQLSAVQLLVPFGYAIKKREFILAISLALLSVSVVILNRPTKHAIPDYVNVINHYLVGAWLTAIAYISLTVTNENIIIVGSACLSLSVLLAMIRKQWPVTSNPRVCMHVATYFAASLGTMIFLNGSDRNSLSCSFS